MNAIFTNNKSTVYSMSGKKLFSTQDKSKYILALDKYQSGMRKRHHRKKFYTFLNILLSGCFGGFYLYYIGKASGLFSSMKLNSKYKEHLKNVQEKHNINQEIIDQKIKDFDEKYEINKQIELYEEKLKYGNKELNERVQTLIDTSESSNVDASKENNTIDLFSKEGDNSDENILLQEHSDFGENIIYSKNNDFEQLKILQTSQENNPDPRIMGNTIIFDSRFNVKSEK
jgi:hypothetical protein